MQLPCALACARWRLATVRCCWMDALCCCWEWIVMRAIHMEGSTSLCSGLENGRHFFLVRSLDFKIGSSEKPTLFIIFHPFFPRQLDVSHGETRRLTFTIIPVASQNRGNWKRTCGCWRNWVRTLCVARTTATSLKEDVTRYLCCDCWMIWNSETFGAQDWKLLLLV